MALCRNAASLPLASVPDIDPPMAAFNGGFQSDLLVAGSTTAIRTNPEVQLGCLRGILLANPVIVRIGAVLH